MLPGIKQGGTFIQVTELTEATRAMMELHAQLLDQNAKACLTTSTASRCMHVVRPRLPPLNFFPVGTRVRACMHTGHGRGTDEAGVHTHARARMRSVVNAMTRLAAAGGCASSGTQKPIPAAE